MRAQLFLTVEILTIVAARLDINAYEEALDDFGNNADDFM